jgi:hypothetical protein
MLGFTLAAYNERVQTQQQTTIELMMCTGIGTLLEADAEKVEMVRLLLIMQELSKWISYTLNNTNCRI